LKLTAGVDLVPVPYKGAALAIADVVAGHVPTGFVTLAAALPQLRTGKLRALAVTSVQRSAAAPAVATMAESGLPSVVIAEWFGILAPAATPKAVVYQLNQEINSVLQTPEVQARFSEQGFEPMTRTIDYFESLIKSDISQMGMIIKRAGIRAAAVTP
jgi:tripartite-type tricarboxylate transporter receptor subunit TctC